jgi:hypothetical protein
MAVYESRFKELGFYVNGKFHTFKNGRYVTDDKSVMAVLDKLADVKRVDEGEAQPNAAEEPKPKAKKASAK